MNTIAATTTSTGLKVHADLDTGTYQEDIKITDKAMKAFEQAGAAPPPHFPRQLELHPARQAGRHA